MNNPTWLLVLGMMLAFVACGDDSDAAAHPVQTPSRTATITPTPTTAPTPTSFVCDQRIIYSDGLHNENTEMINLGDRLLLIFRGGEEGQIGSAKARIKIFESTDNGRSFTLISEVDANNLPGERDIRDPKLVAMHGVLFLYAISRLPGAHYRDLFGNAWTLRAESTDQGHTWTAPVKTYEDISAAGVETYWGFWRFTKRQYDAAGERKEALFATAYNDGDSAVALFATDDGIHWEKRGAIIRSSSDVPSEAELQFFGDNNETAVSLVRLDNQDILADGQTAICTSTDPFATWECGRRIEQRLDGPTWIVRTNGKLKRSFVFARKHLPCTFKRTAAYELRGDLTNPSAPIEVCEIQEVKSSGDTAYTSVVELNPTQSLLSWYSSPVTQELPWLEGQFSPSDIWLATVNFDAAPMACIHPAAKRACAPPPLPPGSMAFDITGSHLLTLAPVIYPRQEVFFQADIAIRGLNLDFLLQPLDAVTKTPAGAPWSAADIPIAADASFTADFGTQDVPPAAYPLLNDPFLRVGNFMVIGKATSRDGFCGHVAGYAQVLGDKPADRIGLNGSTFGAARITGGILPPPVSTCP